MAEIRRLLAEMVTAEQTLLQDREQLANAGARTIRAVAWPDDRPAVLFFRAIGFRAEEGPGSMNLYGVPAWPDHEFEGEDRAIFVREIASRG